jgi:hypothetical protein
LTLSLLIRLIKNRWSAADGRGWIGGFEIVSVETSGLCLSHTFETAQEICRRCGGEFCEMCLLFPFGNAKPLCKQCAMAAGGARNHASRAEMPIRDVKRMGKAFKDRRNGIPMAPTPEAPKVVNPILHDPLAPTPEDLERIPAPVPDDGAGVAADLADVFNATPPPPPSPSVDGVAPPIGWNQPFG